MFQTGVHLETEDHHDVNGADEDMSKHVDNTPNKDKTDYENELMNDETFVTLCIVVNVLFISDESSDKEPSSKDNDNQGHNVVVK